MSEDILRRPLGLLLQDATNGSPTVLRQFARKARQAADMLSSRSPTTGGRPFPYTSFMLRELAAHAEGNANAAALEIDKRPPAKTIAKLIAGRDVS
jgi:hypothetical protein